MSRHQITVLGSKNYDRPEAKPIFALRLRETNPNIGRAFGLVMQTWLCGESKFLNLERRPRRAPGRRIESGVEALRSFRLYKAGIAGSKAGLVGSSHPFLSFEGLVGKARRIIRSSVGPGSLGVCWTS